MENSKKWALGFIVFGMIFLGLFTILSSKQNRSLQSATEIAIAEVYSGETFVLRSQPPQKEKIINRKWIRALESIETGPSADVILEFKSNFRIKPNPQSLVTLDSKDGVDLILIKKGNITFENYGPEGSLFILKDGQKINGTEYGLAQEKKSVEPRTAVQSNASKNTRLTHKMIQDLLNNAKVQFYKCYSQLLQKTPGVNGQASIAFMIQPTGRVSQPEITSSSLSDSQFKKCLIGVIERVEFPPFSGNTISTEFPIRFE